MVTMYSSPFFMVMKSIPVTEQKSDGQVRSSRGQITSSL